MADSQGGGDFFERGVRLFLDVGGKFLGIQLAPFPPACLRGEGASLGSGQIAVNRAPPQIKPPGSLGLGAASLKKFHDTFPQIQRISFHTHKPISLCANVNVICYSFEGNLFLICK